MRMSGVIAGICILAGLLAACGEDASKPERPEVLLATVPGQFSYTMGHDTVALMNSMEAVPFEEQAFLLGVTDALEQVTPRLSEADMNLVRKMVGRQERDLRNEQIKRLSRKNKEQQAAWLAQNREAEGVVATASGLQYKIIHKGSGNGPKPADIVRVNMEVALPDGTIIDSTYRRGGPAMIKVENNLAGYQEALLLMTEGAKYRFWIPYQLAYGETGNYADGGRVGPCQMLVLEMELLDIVDPPEPSDETTN